jgi:hypothetical protein
VPEVVATVPALPDLLAVVCAIMTLGGSVAGLLVGKASTWRRAFEDIALGATVGGACGCLVVLMFYSLIKVIGE